MKKLESIDHSKDAKRIEDPARFPNPSTPVAGHLVGGAASDFAKCTFGRDTTEVPSDFGAHSGPKPDQEREYHFQEVLGLQPYTPVFRGGKR